MSPEAQEERRHVERRKRSVSEGDTVRIAIDGAPGLVLNLRPKESRHPVTEDTIVEWVAEDGERTISRGIQMDHCW